MWKYPDDNTHPIITAKAHIHSGHANEIPAFPKTAVLFYMHSGEEYLQQNYPTHLLCEKFPRFLRACPVYQFDADNHFCFLDGGRGAPQAVDTLEILAALGVQNVLSVGMFGAFGEEIDSGDILIPHKAFVEEGTSLHYYDSIEEAAPSSSLHRLAMETVGTAKSLPIVSCDAVYRQTFYKEQLWRDKGAVGVDMETSALFSVGAYLGLNVVSILIASDKHPLHEGDPAWAWTMTQQSRHQFFEQALQIARKL